METEIAFIYALIDPDSKQVRYIGKTTRPLKRLKEHINETKYTNTYKSKWIKSLLDLDKKPMIEILKICPLSDFVKHETYFIQLHKSEYLTNSDETGQGNINRKKEIIDASIEKISKTVYQFDLNGNFLKEFKSVREASRQLSIDHSQIVRNCNNIAKHAGGFIFSYNQNENENKKITNPNAIRKQVIEINIEGNEINRWISLMECSRNTNIDNGNLSRVCNNKLPSIKGRFFKFV